MSKKCCSEWLWICWCVERLLIWKIKDILDSRFSKNGRLQHLRSLRRRGAHFQLKESAGGRIKREPRDLHAAILGCLCTCRLSPWRQRVLWRMEYAVFFCLSVSPAASGSSKFTTTETFFFLKFSTTDRQWFFKNSILPAHAQYVSLVLSALLLQMRIPS